MKIRFNMSERTHRIVQLWDVDGDKCFWIDHNSANILINDIGKQKDHVIKKEKIVYIL